MVLIKWSKYKPKDKISHLLKFLKILSIQLAIDLWYEGSFHLV